MIYGSLEAALITYGMTLNDLAWALRVSPEAFEKWMSVPGALPDKYAKRIRDLFPDEGAELLRADQKLGGRKVVKEFLCVAPRMGSVD